MKKQIFASSVLVGFLLCACTQHAGNTSIKLSESDHYYNMNAWFVENRMDDVEAFMNDRIGRRNNLSFSATNINGRLTLDDRTTFFIKKFPGHIEIKLDKDENSSRSYQTIKSLCEGIKDVLH
jgi:hypothetical protein